VLKEGSSSKDLLKKDKEVSKEQYGFIDCSDGRQPNDGKTRKFVRTHVMHNYRRQQRVAADVISGLQNNDTETIVELEHPLVSSLERWNADPFDSFPIKMQPYMHENLSLCKPTSPLIYQISSHLIVWYL